MMTIPVSHGAPDNGMQRTALVYPDKKLAGVKAKSVTKRMKEKAFAASVNRETILECERIGIPLDEFAGIALKAMQDIHEQLGL